MGPDVVPVGPGCRWLHVVPVGPGCCCHSANNVAMIISSVNLQNILNNSVMRIHGDKT